MATFRQNILTQLEADLPKIKVSNGYNTNLYERISRGFVDLSDDMQLPNVFYMLGSETSAPSTEDNDMYSHSTQIIVGVNFSVNSDFENKGILTDEYEKIISDIKNFFHQGLAQCFDYREVLNSGSQINGYIPDIETIEPYIDWQNNKGVVLITAKIEYDETI